MLKIELPGGEFWDNEKNVFITTKKQSLRLEHSLISLTRWEQHYHRRYLSEKNGPKSSEEIAYYFYCMSLDSNVDLFTFQNLPMNVVKEILDYIHDPMTATEITKHNQQKKTNARPEELSSELIYCYMFELGIPKECEKWHLNNLLTLIQVMSIKNAPPEKMNKKAAMRNIQAINAANRARFHTRG